MKRNPSWTPSRRQVLIAGGLTGAGLSASALHLSAQSSDLKTAQRFGIAFGTKVSLKACHTKADILDSALDAAWHEMLGVEAAATLFRVESPICQLNRTGRLDNPPELLVQMLKDSLEIARLTDGAFDPTVQPLWRVYAGAYKQQRYASEAEITAARALIGWRNIEIEDKRIQFTKPGMALTLNGIAQGFATGRCLEALAKHGVENAFLDTGEIGASGKRDDQNAWTAGIADPRNQNGVIALARPLNGILATSGDYATVWSDDYTHHHILDPQTARSPYLTASVSVLAQSGGMADGLATAMMVMGPEKSLSLAQNMAGVEAVIITKSGERFVTSRFPLA